MSQTTVGVKHGEEFSVRLQGNESAGYRWELVSVPEGVEHLGTDIEPPAAGSQETVPADEHATSVFRFRVHTPGTSQLQFVLKRPWESDALDRHDVAVIAH
jgi:predicted secreted protein